MAATIIVGIIVAGVIALAVRNIARNIKQGKGFDGCVGDCSKCHGCKH